MKKTMLLIVVIMAMVMAMAPVKVLAGTNPYKDVTKKSVDSASYSAIAYVKQHHGWTGLSKNSKLYPNKYMTRREFILSLYNLYGEKVPATVADVINANKVVTSEYVCNKCVALSKNLGYSISWTGNSSKMKRKDVARYIKIFATYNSALKPRK